MPNQQQEIDMYRDLFEGNWKHYGGKAEEQRRDLANALQREPAGTRDQHAGRIQERYKISNQEAARQLDDFLDHSRNWWDFPNR